MNSILLQYQVAWLYLQKKSGVLINKQTEQKGFNQISWGQKIMTSGLRIFSLILNNLGTFLGVGVTHKKWNSKMLIFMAPKII